MEVNVVERRPNKIKAHKSHENHKFLLSCGRKKNFIKIGNKNKICFFVLCEDLSTESFNFLFFSSERAEQEGKVKNLL
jgi:hypothetical protein